MVFPSTLLFVIFYGELFHNFPYFPMSFSIFTPPFCAMSIFSYMSLVSPRRALSQAAEVKARDEDGAPKRLLGKTQQIGPSVFFF